MFAGSKSSIFLNFNWMDIWLPSPWRVFSTLKLSPGAMRPSTSSKLSRSTWMNFRSESGFSGSVGLLPEKSPSTHTTKGNSFLTVAPSVSTW